MSAIPTSYLAVITPLIDTARGILETGESLTPIAFVGNFASGTTFPVVLETAIAGDKNRSERTIRAAAARSGADYIFVISEAWTLPKDKIHKAREILDRYGSIGASPYALDLAIFTLETHHGTWVAQIAIAPKGSTKNKRTFGNPKFDYFTELQGRFVDLLPKSESAERPGSLH